MHRFLSICLLSFMLLIMPASAQAHALDQLLHDLRVQIQPTQIVVNVHLIAGPLITPRLWADLDHDQSGDLSSAEIMSWCEQFQRAMTIQFDGVALELSQPNIKEFASDKPTFIGEGATNLEWVAIAPLPNLSAGEHRAVFQSNAYADMSATDWSKTRGRAGIVVRESTIHADRSVEFPLKVPEIFKDDGSPLPEARATAQPSSSDTLIQRLRMGEISWNLVLITLGLSLLFGALHALQPGHGKTLVAAYLIGSRGTAKQAIWLGSIVTFTHTASVFLLGTLMLLFSAWITPQKIIPALTLISGLLIVGLGLRLLWQRIQQLRHKTNGHSHGGVFHSHAHDDHDHQHVTNGSLLSLGISGGIVPCPEALAIMIVAATIGRIGLGLAMIVAFSVGLAAVLIVIGLVLVGIGERAFKHTKPDSMILRWLPVVSAVLVIGLGAALTVQGFI